MFLVLDNSGSVVSWFIHHPYGAVLLVRGRGRLRMTSTTRKPCHDYCAVSIYPLFYAFSPLATTMIVLSVTYKHSPRSYEDGIVIDRTDVARGEGGSQSPRYPNPLLALCFLDFIQHPFHPTIKGVSHVLDRINRHLPIKFASYVSKVTVLTQFLDRDKLNLLATHF